MKHFKINVFFLYALPCQQVFIDGLLFSTLLTAILSVKFDSRFFMALSGLSMCYTLISAHNFFHRRDNFRMLYFNLTFLNYKEWRISHAMSHHLFPNSLYDLEIVLFEPIFCWIPSPMKTFTQRYVSWLYSPIIYAFLFVDQLAKRIVFSITTKTNLFERCDMIPLVVPLAMFLFGSTNLYSVLVVWIQIIFTSSFIFGAIGLNAGHHSPSTNLFLYYIFINAFLLCSQLITAFWFQMCYMKVIKSGKFVYMSTNGIASISFLKLLQIIWQYGKCRFLHRDDLDWGVYSMDTLMDNTDIRKHHFLALTHFGHHALHHLFPTLDHSILPEFYPILFKTMEEFEVELDAYPWYHMVYGQFMQLTRNKPNPIDSLEKLRRKKNNNKNVDNCNISRSKQS